MAKVVGIDLGRTNSCVAVMEGGEPVVITNALRTARYPFRWGACTKTGVSEAPLKDLASSVKSPDTNW